MARALVTTDHFCPLTFLFCSRESVLVITLQVDTFLNQLLEILSKTGDKFEEQLYWRSSTIDCSQLVDTERGGGVVIISLFIKPFSTTLLEENVLQKGNKLKLIGSFIRLLGDWAHWLWRSSSSAEKNSSSEIKMIRLRSTRG